MDSTTINENSMFSDATGRAALVANPKLVTELFFVNFLGFLGLYALNDSRGYMKMYETSEKRLKISEIADDNHDVSLVVKLCVDAGVLTEALATPVTRLLALIKQRTIRAKDVDDAKIRDIITHTMLVTKPMDAQVKTLVTSFMNGTIGLKEFSRLIYDVSKKNAWRDHTLELRNLVIKGQYTDYFGAMKKAVAAGGSAASVAPAAPAPAVAKPAAPKTVTADDVVPFFQAEFAKAWVEINGSCEAMNIRSIYEAAVAASGYKKGSFAWNGLAVDDMVKAIPAVVAALPDAALEKTKGGTTHSGWSGPPDTVEFKAVRYAVALRIVKWANTPVKWNNINVVVPVDANVLEYRNLLDAMRALVPKFTAAPKDLHEHENWLTFGANLRSLIVHNQLELLLRPRIRPLEKDHRVHFEMILGNGASVRAVDTTDYGKEAMAWIRKFGTTINIGFARRGHMSSITALRPASAITSTVWKDMNNADRMVWMASNFNVASVRKSAPWFRAARNAPAYVRSVNSQVAGQMAKALGPILSDEAFISSVLNQAGDPETWSSMLAVCAMHTILNDWKPHPTLSQKVRSAIRMNLSSYGSTWDDGLLALRKLVDMPATTATEVQAIIDMAATFGENGSGYGRIINESVIGEFDAKLPMPQSLFHVIAFAPIRRSDKAGVATHSDDGIVFDADPAKMDASNIEFIRKFGDMYPRKLKQASAPLSDEDGQEAIAAVMIATKDVVKGTRIRTGLYNEVKNWGDQQWGVVIKRMVANGKWPSIFKDYNQYGGSDMIAGEYVSDLGKVKDAARTYVINNLTPSQLGDVVPVLMDPSYLRLPLTAEKMAAAEFAGIAQLARWSGNNTLESMDQFDAYEIINAGLTAGLLGSTHPTFSKLLIASIKWTGSRAEETANAIAASNDEIFRPLLAKSFDDSSSSKISTGMFAATRWAYGFTAAEVEAAVRAGKKDREITPQQPFLVPARYLMDAAGFVGPVKEMWAQGRNTNYSKFNVMPWAEFMPDDLIPAKPEDCSSFSEWLGTLTALETNENVRDKIIAGREEAKKGFSVMWTDGNVSPRASRMVISAMTRGAGGDDAEFNKVAIAWNLERLIAQKEKPAALAEFVDSIDNTANLSADGMKTLVKVFTSTDSKGAISALAELAFEPGKKVVTKSFIDAVRAAGKEKAVMSRLAKTGSMVGAADALNADPHAIPITIDQQRAETFLKYNDIDLSKISTLQVNKLEDFGTASAVQATHIPPLAVTPVLGSDELVARTRTLHRANSYNHQPAVGLEVAKIFSVAIPGQREKFEAWTKANPAAKIMTLYHGSGTINAAFILRFGFKIIKSTDPSVTGRMLGDGVYFADNINKTMLYMSNSGYIRQPNQEGFVFKCKVALGNSPKDYREGKAERRSLVSNEWSIMTTDQIIIEEAYYGHSREHTHLKTILNEEAAMIKSRVSSFMFMDGLIPIDAELMVDFEKLPDFGPHVSIETSAKGPIVNIRHDSTVEVVNRCYRWGEELQANTEELTAFVNLLRNRY